jgi:IS5 family transposase
MTTKTDIAAAPIVALRAPSPSSPAPLARGGAALGLDRAVQPSKLTDRTADASHLLDKTQIHLHRNLSHKLVTFPPRVTVQRTTITLPTHAKLLYAAITALNRLPGNKVCDCRSPICAWQARRHDGGTLRLRQTVQPKWSRFAPAAHMLGRIIRDIRRKIAGKADLETAFKWPLMKVNQIRSRQERQRDFELCSFHTPEVECIGKGEARPPYEFGIKASIVKTNARAPGGQFVLHASRCRTILMTATRSAPSSPQAKGSPAERASASMSTRDTRGDDTANPRRVFISGQNRDVSGMMLRRRPAIEAVIGDMKIDGHSDAASSKVAKATPLTSALRPSVATSASSPLG